MIEVNNRKREDARAYDIAEKLGLPVNTVLSVIRELRYSYRDSLDAGEPVNMLGLFSISVQERGGQYHMTGRTTYQPPIE